MNQPEIVMPYTALLNSYKGGGSTTATAQIRKNNGEKETPPSATTGQAAAIAIAPAEAKRRETLSELYRAKTEEKARLDREYPKWRLPLPFSVYDENTKTCYQEPDILAYFRDDAVQRKYRFDPRVYSPDLEGYNKLKEDLFEAARKHMGTRLTSLGSGGKKGTYFRKIKCSCARFYAGNGRGKISRECVRQRSPGDNKRCPFVFLIYRDDVSLYFKGGSKIYGNADHQFHQHLTATDETLVFRKRRARKNGELPALKPIRDVLNPHFQELCQLLDGNYSQTEKKHCVEMFRTAIETFRESRQLKKRKRDDDDDNDDDDGDNDDDESSE